MIAFSEILDTIAHAPIQKRAMTNHGVLNEAYAYAKPSSFSRGMRIDLNGLTILLISGTASIDENGVSVHIGDFRAQMQRTFDNITGLLESEGCTWHDIVRTTCYLRDIDRDYDAFNEERTAFFKAQGLDPLPASTGIQAHLCRPELLIEIEAIAMFRTEKIAHEGVVAMRKGWWLAAACILAVGSAANVSGQEAKQGKALASAARIRRDRRRIAWLCLMRANQAI